MTTGESSSRKRRGAWYTPSDLVDLVVANTIDGWDGGTGTLRVLDPACGDGRFLVAIGDALHRRGVRAELVGVDVDAASVSVARQALTAALPDHEISVIHGDALELSWDDASFHAVVGNPPFLSQLATATRRAAPSRFGGGPYADTAVEFLALAVRLVAAGGRVGLIMPQSVLASRDAASVRAQVDRQCARVWSWWSPDRHFDAEVVVCALGFERRVNGHRHGAVDATTAGRWTDVVTSTLGVPPLPPLHTDGTVGDRGTASANFRDEYYGLVPAVVEGGDGAPLVTTGLIDPGGCRWGRHPARFARRRFQAPTVRFDQLDDRMRDWASSRLVPKVLMATQTQVVEAVADPDGRWLPCVPITTITPREGTPVDAVWALAAVLTSPVASVWAWHGHAGTGLSPSSLRLGPRVIAALPWPAGDLTDAVRALQAGDVAGCGRAVDIAYGVTDETCWRWWVDALPVRD